MDIISHVDSCTYFIKERNRLEYIQIRLVGIFNILFNLSVSSRVQFLVSRSDVESTTARLHEQVSEMQQQKAPVMSHQRPRVIKLGSLWGI